MVPRLSALLVFGASMLEKELKCLKYTVLFHKFTKEKSFRVRHHFCPGQGSGLGRVLESLLRPQGLSFLSWTLLGCDPHEGLTGRCWCCHCLQAKTHKRADSCGLSVWGRPHAATVPPLAFHAKSSGLALKNQQPLIRGRAGCLVRVILVIIPDWP